MPRTLDQLSAEHLQGKVPAADFARELSQLCEPHRGPKGRLEAAEPALLDRARYLLQPGGALFSALPGDVEAKQSALVHQVCGRIRVDPAAFSSQLKRDARVELRDAAEPLSTKGCGIKTRLLLNKWMAREMRDILGPIPKHRRQVPLTPARSSEAAQRDHRFELREAPMDELLRRCDRDWAHYVHEVEASGIGDHPLCLVHRRAVRLLETRCDIIARLLQEHKRRGTSEGAELADALVEIENKTPLPQSILDAEFKRGDDALVTPKGVWEAVREALLEPPHVIRRERLAEAVGVPRSTWYDWSRTANQELKPYMDQRLEQERNKRRQSETLAKVPPSTVDNKRGESDAYNDS